MTPSTQKVIPGKQTKAIKDRDILGNQISLALGAQKALASKQTSTLMIRTERRNCLELHAQKASLGKWTPPSRSETKKKRILQVPRKP